MNAQLGAGISRWNLKSKLQSRMRVKCLLVHSITCRMGANFQSHPGGPRRTKFCFERSPPFSCAVGSVVLFCQRAVLSCCVMLCSVLSCSGLSCCVLSCSSRARGGTPGTLGDSRGSSGQLGVWRPRHAGWGWPGGLFLKSNNPNLWGGEKV